jgi:hypothetical protein
MVFMMRSGNQIDIHNNTWMYYSTLTTHIVISKLVLPCQKLVDARAAPRIKKIDYAKNGSKYYTSGSESISRLAQVSG